MQCYILLVDQYSSILSLVVQYSSILSLVVQCSSILSLVDQYSSILSLVDQYSSILSLVLQCCSILSLVAHRSVTCHWLLSVVLSSIGWLLNAVLHAIGWLFMISNISTLEQANHWGRAKGLASTQVWASFNRPFVPAIIPAIYTRYSASNSEGGVICNSYIR